MTQAIFISIGFPTRDDTSVPGMDHINSRELLFSISDVATIKNSTLVARAHPAITTLLKGAMSAKPDNLILVDENLSAKALAERYKFTTAFFVAGSAGVIEDFKQLSAHGGIRLVPLPTSGGAATLLDREQQKAAPDFTIDRNDQFGFSQVYRAVADEPV